MCIHPFIGIMPSEGKDTKIFSTHLFGLGDKENLYPLKRQMTLS